MNERTNFLTGDEQSSGIKGQYRLILKLFLSLGLIGLVLFFIDLQEMAAVFMNLDLWYLLPVVVLVYVDRILMAYKWNLLLQVIGVQAPFYFLFKAYTIASLSGLLLPSALSGDLFRLYSLSRYKADLKAVMASMIVERVIGLVAMLILATLSLGLVFYLMKDTWVHSTEIALILIMGIAIVVCSIGVTHNFFRKSLGKMLNQVTKNPIIGKFYSIYALFCEYRKHLSTLVAVSAWTLLEQIAPIVIIALTVKALHISISLLAVVAIIPLIVLAVRLPIPFDTFGVQEGLYIAMFGLVGVSASEAFLLSTLGRVVPLICALPWGLHYILTWRQIALSEPQITARKPL